MTPPQVLLLHSSQMSPVSIQKLLAERQFLVHLSRNWKEAERVCKVVPEGQLKYVFVDITLCADDAHDVKLRVLPTLPDQTLFIYFHPRFPQALATLLHSEPLDAPTQAVEMETSVSVVVGESSKFCEVRNLVDRYAPYDITVLITGETGTGKEVMARYIHERSARSQGPFVACNMTAIPETLVESELFGYVKGAFTGADKNKKGLIEAAEGGTLFLDEIGDLSLAIQLKLLRFLESREFYRVGESSAKKANVRVVAATNSEIEKAIQDRRFREDLYYRLNNARLILPPLRERGEDLLLLVSHFIAQACRQTQKPLKKISQSVQTLLMDYSWPGNIRELRNVVESAVLVSDGEYITLSDLSMHLQHYATSHREEISVKVLSKLGEAEQAVIKAALAEASGDKTLAAKRLGISLRTLYRKLEKMPEFREVRNVSAAALGSS